ncbi:MAG: hypothetical protein FWD52_06655 [Candidatus Bathyarchaeota archaeon]|nr:hypothetical protein [Candidatus Termiticorpusculum sp.]
MTSFNFTATTAQNVSPFASEMPEKIVNNWSELEAALNGAVQPTVIVLNTNVILKEGIVIQTDKNITLTSANGKTYKLTGFISVSGVLTLDGIIIMQPKGAKSSRGLFVYEGGTLILNKGEISGNTVTGSDKMIPNRGGGVYVDSGGTFVMRSGVISGNSVAGIGGGVYNNGRFTMFGGVISNNKATIGGGVYNDGGVFTMSGGVITNNTATESDGGGVYNRGGAFTMSSGVISNNEAINGGGVYNDARMLSISGGAITNNKALEFGGGVHVKTGSFSMSGDTVISSNIANFGGGVVHNGSTFTMSSGVISDNTATDGGGVYVGQGGFNLSGGTVSNNRATDNGGGIWVVDNFLNLNRLFVAKEVVFSNNYASVAYNRNKIHDVIYNAQIKSDTWSKPFTQGYNNYDIGYMYGTPLRFYNVTVHNSYAELTGAGSYTIGAVVTVDAGIRDGYTFSGWRINRGGVTLSNTTTTTFTMPANGVVVTANWTANYVSWILKTAILCTILVILIVTGVLLHRMAKKKQKHP